MTWQRELLECARTAIHEHVRTGRATLPSPTAHPPPVTPGGVFVTLHLLLPDGTRELRGCIGTLDVDAPLHRVVARMAVAAASRDPRFPPLRAEELPAVELEISLLSPLRRLGDPKDLEIGVHGLHVTRGDRHGLLLPQVAPEHGWDKEQFLAHACRKADLCDDAWRDPETLIEVFTADVLREPSSS